MIARILGEGQFTLPDEHLDELNALDDALLAAVDHDDDAAFGEALRKLLAATRRFGTPLPADALIASEFVLPTEDSTVAQVRELLSDDGLIPG
ncbi:hypothetical protein HFP15_39220 [Amycolatopsis sp. K13G38]|uniref:PspA-associated domain-containing protein n=1 Tax=Amycolatopsis acididurans TaxID=2724524 RepID=A0ABX1JGH8_9PSEU|nr:hypothetical protein [Amycolatopsis acididurans]NKQ58892.1 hypothetical protein [Amycolatopsis acididurans]